MLIRHFPYHSYSVLCSRLELKLKIYLRVECDKNMSENRDLTVNLTPLPVRFCDFNTCDSCDVNYAKFYAIRASNEGLTSFLNRHGVVPCHHTCRKCGTTLLPTCCGNLVVFRCQKRYSKKSTRKCNTNVSIYKNTFFENVKLNINIIAEFVFLYLTRPPPRCKFIQRELGLTSVTVIDFFSFIREVFIYWAARNSEIIGGEGKIVEIDEAKIGKRKYNKGRYLHGQWVFGGIERGTRKFFMVAVEDRTSETLVNIIKNKIRPNTTIYSDCWKSYDNLDKEGYSHLTVNHSLNFVEPQTGTHTQNIERMWLEVRKLVPRFGRRKKHYEGYLSECLFVMRHPDHRTRFHAFWKIAGELYSGLPH